MKQLLNKASNVAITSYLYLVLTWAVVALGVNLYMVYLDATRQDLKIKTIVSWFYSTFDGNKNSDTAYIK